MDGDDCGDRLETALSSVSVRELRGVCDWAAMLRRTDGGSEMVTDGGREEERCAGDVA